MRSRSMCLVGLCFAARLHAQSATGVAADSVRQVVQRFYDWYVPASADDQIVMKAARNGPLPFDPTLVHWLRVDSTAQARAVGEIDGMDWDPYLNAQDFCDTYTVRSVRARRAVFLVEVVGHGGCAAHRTADVVVEIGRQQGRWTALEFRDPGRHNEGLIPVLKRLHPRPGGQAASGGPADAR